MADRPRLSVGASMPDLTFTWRDYAGNVIDFAAEPHTFELRIPTAPLFTKGTLGGVQTGITSSSTAPNVRIQWTQGELDSIAAGFYSAELWARRTSDGRIRSPLRFDVEIEHSLRGWIEPLTVTAAAAVAVTDVL